MCWKKEKDKPIEPNCEQKFWKRQYWAFTPKFMVLQFFTTLAIFVLNCIGLTKMIEYEQKDSDYSRAQSFINDIISLDSKERYIFGQDAEKCASCVEADKSKVSAQVRSQDYMIMFESIRSGLLVAQTVISVIILLLISIQSYKVLEKVYIGFFNLVPTDLNVDIYLLHALNYSSSCDNCPDGCRKWIIVVKKMFLSLIFIAFFLYFIYTIVAYCNASGNSDKESNKLIQLVQKAQAEFNSKGIGQINVDDVVFSIKFIRDTSTSCSAKSIFGYMFSDFWRAFSTLQFIKIILETIYEVYDLVFNRKDSISHYKIDEQTNHLIPEPNQQEDKSIPMTRYAIQQKTIQINNHKGLVNLQIITYLSQLKMDYNHYKL